MPKTFTLMVLSIAWIVQVNHASADPVLVKWSDIGKTVDIVGTTGTRLFTPTIYEIQWDHSDSIVNPVDPNWGDVHGCKVVRADGNLVAPPVEFSAKRGEVEYFDYGDASDESRRNRKWGNRIWGQENGRLDIPPSQIKGLRLHELPPGTQLNLSWTIEFVVRDDATPRETPADAEVKPKSKTFIKMEEFSKGVEVQGQLGHRLGRVCRIKGTWDHNYRYGPFRISEVDGKGVENISWPHGAILEYDLTLGKVLHCDTKADNHSGETWILEGVEIGRFLSIADGYPPGRDVPMWGDRTPGFVTEFRWWSREKAKE